ncbi:MAG: vWA domain-containing protein [Solirubrobacteraceae bacterium]
MSDPAAIARELEQAGRSVSDRCGALVGGMRIRGARIGVGELLAAHRALAVVDPAVREDARLALRTVLCSGREDLERFEAAFVGVFGAGPRLSDEAPVSELGTIEREALPHAAVPADDPMGRPPSGKPEQRAVPAAWSSVELLLEKDFSRYTEAEIVLARRLIARLARRGPVRRSRRLRPVRRRGRRPDLRRMVRASLRTGGEPVLAPWLGPSQRPRPVVLVCDVSGSMAPYARMLLQYMHACVAARARVEAFAFGTKLTRVTRELEGRDHDRALERAVLAVSDLSGGTRIGEALAELNRRHGRRVGRGAVVVILSDGWDRGDPELVASEMARLRRTAHHLVWLNPLAAHPRFEPLSRGMQAAMPHTDTLLAGNSLASLEQLAETLEGM